MPNKKIINATPSSLGCVSFRSKLEKSVYEAFLGEGMELQVEPKKIVLVEGFYPKVPFFKESTTKPKSLILSKRKLLEVTYTPDFYLLYKNMDIWIEAKGFPNDVFYLKEKLFLKYLENNEERVGRKAVYFKVKTKRQALEAIKILKEWKI
ncbi:MAG: hypothetical protein J6W71_06750 [Methanobrevibacter sp.]|nr:hypothetical protein [Methanobrevibacter sp.]